MGRVLPAPRMTAAFAAIYLVWGSTFLAIRWAVETIPPFTMMAMRCLLGGAVLRLVLGQGTRLTLVGVTVGVLAARGFARLFPLCFSVSAPRTRLPSPA